MAKAINSLTHIQEVEIPRKKFRSNAAKLIEMHGFSGATLQGYGACIYLLTVYESGDISVNLLSVKFQKAPLKDATKQKI